MKQFYYGLFVLFLLCGYLIFPAYADDAVETIDPKQLLSTADEEIFVRNAFAQNFSEAQGYVNELPNRTTIHQYYIYNGVGTDLLMSMRPALETVRTTNKRINFDQSRKEEFHVTFSVRQGENIPAGSGGKCYIRLSNVILLGKGRESGLIIYPGDQAYYFTPVDGEMTYEPVGDISSVNPERMTKFDIIRLNNNTYVYADGKYLFNYQDEIKEAVTIEGGAELSLGGNRVRCDFDDFNMRTK